MTSADNDPNWFIEIKDLEKYIPAAKGLQKTCDILSFSHGIYREGDHAEHNHLSVVKYLDAWTPYLYQICNQGIVMEQITMNINNEAVNTIYTLHNAKLSTLRPGGSRGSYEQPVEELAFSYESITVSYADEQYKGSATINNVHS